MPSLDDITGQTNNYVTDRNLPFYFDVTKASRISLLIIIAIFIISTLHIW